MIENNSYIQFKIKVMIRGMLILAFEQSDDVFENIIVTIFFVSLKIVASSVFLMSTGRMLTGLISNKTLSKINQLF